MRSSLEDERTRLGASTLVLLVADKRALLRSLTYVVGHGRAQVEALFRPSDRNQSGGRPLFRSIRDLLDGRPPTEPLCDKLFDALNLELENLQPGSALRNPLLVGITKVQPWRARISSSDLRLVLIADISKSNEVSSDETLEDLLMMACATPQAESRRDTSILETMSTVLANAWRDGTTDSILEFADSASELCMRVTGATSAAIFLRDGEDTDKLVRVGNPKGTYYNAVRKISINQDPELTVTMAGQRSLHRTKSNPAGVELVTPIPWMSASPASISVGAILLHGGESTVYFPAYEVSLVRNVALRLAIFRNTIAAREIGTAISRLRRPGVRYENNFPLPESRAVSRDVSLALSRVSPELAVLGSETLSHSISLRLVWPLIGSEDAKLALFRIAAYPESELERPEVAQTLDAGVNWFVARSGTTWYEPDTSQPEARFTKFRDGTRSELCVPIRSQGHLIGVLNLESPYPNAYDQLSPLVEAFAGAIGRTFADSVSFFGRSVIERALLLDTLWHDIKKPIQRARKKLNETTQPLADLEGIKAEVVLAEQQLLEGQAAEQVGSSGPRTVEELISNALTRIGGFVSLRHSSSVEAVYDRRVLGGSEKAFEAALANVFANVKEHSDKLPPSHLTPMLEADEVDLDARKFALIWIDNVVQGTLDVKRVADYYQIPVDVQGKPSPRLGAFLAGAQARSFGGWVHTVPAFQGRHQVIRTVVLCPLG
jgi:GAF domain-containing protein